MKQFQQSQSVITIVKPSILGYDEQERFKNQMLIFGHTGITLGAAVLLDGILTKRYSLSSEEKKLRECDEHSAGTVPTQDCSSGSRASWFISLANHIDIRLLLIGSLLPDIIDKPTGHLFFKDTFSNGRIFSHTLLFFIVITLFAFYLYRSHGKRWLLTLSFGIFAHLMQDQMWLEPQTLLWPLHGFAFERIDLTNWIPGIIHALLTNPRSIYTRAHRCVDTYLVYGGIGAKEKGLCLCQKRQVV